MTIRLPIEIRLWRAQHARYQSAARTLSKLEPEERAGCVARALWQANRQAYSSTTMETDKRAEIYLCKALLIELFYRQGRASTVECHKQFHYCYVCREGKTDDGDVCYQCNGTGIYDVSLLYCFYLNFEGDSYTYAWHVPRWEILYDVITSNDWADAKVWVNSRPRSGVTEALGVGVEFMRVYLAWNGKLPLPRLRDAVKLWLLRRMKR